MRFVTLTVHDVDAADALGNNPIRRDGELVGRATSGGYGFRLGQSLALAMVHPDAGEPGTELTIDILGRTFQATVCGESPFDPENERLRA